MSVIEVIESAEHALARHKDGGLIRAWARLAVAACGCQSCMAWDVTLAGGTEIRLHGYREVTAFCNGLTSAEQAIRARQDLGEDDEEEFGTPEARVLDGMRNAHNDGQGEWLSVGLVAEYAGMQDSQADQVLAGLLREGLVQQNLSGPPDAFGVPGRTWRLT